MYLVNLLERAHTAGYRVESENGELCIEGPPGAIVEELRRNRDALKAYLQEQTEPPALAFSRITSAELAGGDFSVNYLIDGVLVEGQPCLIAGPAKSLKTSLVVDLAVSLSRGGCFLGHFPVLNARRVLVMSGESGMGTLQETARRVCQAARCDLASLAGLFWSSDLPEFGNEEQMAALESLLVNDEIGVVIIDPAFLCLPSGAAERAGNLFAMGTLLRSVNAVCEKVGATCVIVHHIPKSRLNYDPPELSDPAWSGFTEWMRQWVLISRREQYDPETGQHRLWLSVGGSAGHSRLVGLDVEEGRQSDPGGRTWDVSVMSAVHVRRDSKDKRAAERERTQKAKFEADLERARDRLRVHPAGMGKTDWRQQCQFSGERMGRVAAELIHRHEIEEVDVQVRGKKSPITGYRMASVQDGGQTDETDQSALSAGPRDQRWRTDGQQPYRGCPCPSAYHGADEPTFEQIANGPSRTRRTDGWDDGQGGPVLDVESQEAEPQSLSVMEIQL